MERRFGGTLALAGALVALWPATAAGAPAAVTGNSATFADSIGVAIHSFYPDTSYWDKPRLKQLLLDLGVKHVRDGIGLNRHVYVEDGVAGYEYASARDLAASGIKFQWVAGEPDASPNAPSHPSEAIDALTDPARLAGTAEALEGPNEYDRLRRPIADRDPVWATKLYDFMAEFHTAFNNDSRFSALPFYGPSFLSDGGRREYAGMPGSSNFMDAPNAHIYGGGRPPEPAVASEMSIMSGLFGNRAPVVSETGYHTAIHNGNSGHFGVSERAQSIYLARNVLLTFAAGAPRTYVYQFLDQKPEPALKNEQEHFGLVAIEGDPQQSAYRTWTTRKKPAFETLRRILDITRDTGTDARPASLDYSLSGPAAGGLKKVVLARSGGVVDLVLWNPASVYKEPIWDCNHPDIPPTILDPHQRCEWAKYNRAVDQGDLFPSDVPVTLQLGEIADVSTQRPHSQSGFTSRGRGTSFALDVGPDPVFVRIKLSKYATEVRNDEPSAWLRLGESSGTAVDSAGRGATPDPWTAAPTHGQSSAVGDPDDRSVTVGGGQRADVRVPAPGVSTNTGASIELWVKPDPAVPDFADYLTADTPDAWRVRMRAYNPHAGFYWGSTYGSGFGHEMVFKGFDYGQWHHVVLTMAGGNSTTYLDGKKVGERTGGDSLDLRRFTFGAHAGTNPFAGGLDELAVYPKALSAARVCAHYRAAGGSC